MLAMLLLSLKKIKSVIIIIIKLSEFMNFHLPPHMSVLDLS